MARRFITICDVHEILHDEVVEIPEDALYGFNGAWYRFGICEDDRKDLSLADFEEMVTEHGLKLKHGELPDDMHVKKAGGKTAKQAAEPATGDHKCPFGDWSGNSMSSLTMHLKLKHDGMTVVDAFGHVCPVCGKPDIKYLGNHAKAHHVDGAAQLFTLAKDQGDVHGVVVKQVAAGLASS